MLNHACTFRLALALHLQGACISDNPWPALPCQIRRGRATKLDVELRHSALHVHCEAIQQRPWHNHPGAPRDKVVLDPFQRPGTDLLRHGGAGREGDSAVGNRHIHVWLGALGEHESPRGDAEGDVELRLQRRAMAEVRRRIM